MLDGGQARTFSLCPFQGVPTPLPTTESEQTTRYKITRRKRRLGGGGDIVMLRRDLALFHARIGTMSKGSTLFIYNLLQPFAI